MAQGNVQKRQQDVGQVGGVEHVAADQSGGERGGGCQSEPHRIRRKQTAQSRRVKQKRNRKTGTEHDVEESEAGFIRRNEQIGKDGQHESRHDAVDDRTVAVRQVFAAEQTDQQDGRRQQEDMRKIGFHRIQKRRGKDQKRIPQNGFHRVGVEKSCHSSPVFPERMSDGMRRSVHAGPGESESRKVRTAAPVPAMAR